MLSGMIFEKIGDYDDAIIDYRRALKAYQNGYTDGSVPRALIEGLYLSAKKRGRAKIVSSLEKDYPSIVSNIASNYSSLIFIWYGFPVIPKFSRSFVLIGSNDELLRYSWPVIPYVYVPDPVFSLELDGQPFELDLAQDINKIARETLNDARLRMTIKNIARLYAKARAAEEVRRQGGELAGLLASLYAFASETADTRSWSLLPGKFYVRRFLFPAGNKTITSQTLGISEEVVLKPSEVKFVIVKDGKKVPMTWVRKKQVTSK